VSKLQDLTQLASQDRNRGGVLAVCLRGEQSEETVLAADGPIASQSFDPHIVHACAATDGCFRVRLRNDQQRATEGACLQVGRELVDRPGVPVTRFLLVPQDTQTRPLLHLDEIAAALVRPDLVAPVPEEDETGILQPSEQLLDLLQLPGAPGDLLLPLVQFLEDGRRPLDEVWEVGGHRLDVAQAHPHLVLDLLQLLVIERALHGDVDDGGVWTHRRPGFRLDDATRSIAFEHEYGVEQVGDAQIQRVEVFAERIHDERPVRHDRVEDGVLRTPGLRVQPDRDLACGGLVRQPV
jgi:hypothetical protein